MEEYYTWSQLLKKFGYNPNNSCVVADKRLDFMKRRGILLEENSKSTIGKKYYNIIGYLCGVEQEEDWKIYPIDDYFEVSKKGYVRNAKTKVLLGSKHKSYGYWTVTNKNRDYRINRMVLETFNPIENSENYVADHINGIKDDNSLENLRWVTQRINSKLRDENFVKLNVLYQQLIERYGYNELEKEFKELLRRAKK